MILKNSVRNIKKKNIGVGFNLYKRGRKIKNNVGGE